MLQRTHLIGYSLFMSTTYIAAKKLSDAIDYLKATRTPAEWPFFPFQPREQAISILFKKLEAILLSELQ